MSFTESIAKGDNIEMHLQEVLNFLNDDVKSLLSDNHRVLRKYVTIRSVAHVQIVMSTNYPDEEFMNHQSRHKLENHNSIRDSQFKEFESKHNVVITKNHEGAFSLGTYKWDIHIR